MLILSRKEDQKIRIGNDIILKIVSISDGNVKIGIEANKNIKILREEIYQSITDHTQSAVDNITQIIPSEIDSYKLNKIVK
jgi:carbon storage regulator